MQAAAQIVGAVFTALAGDLTTASAEAIASGMGFTFAVAAGLVAMALLAAGGGFGSLVRRQPQQSLATANVFCRSEACPR
ncbi:hypothetical protein [Pseudomonas chlororaphis]|uniref:hypothetical protein n=1 Tax=Pseudomonas chlororaphis TaxID=587753 RepID=UPI000F57782F|nr:hypothetical protein [Pseudomonas chlororaphis]AZD55938.1 Putative transport protein [Pseudomonas chlororaphis subsp. aurantiaca]AZD61963.1 Putative transport protein [Pseudomonas chlororaphis subsp. aurantiaca]QQX62157.1 hypothetical protein JHW28_20130 [Pseudomonas chlororaphis subsp. aurantiaca]UVE48862.1 hypothetical protein KS461_20410 [Pseudomonas chlororaphis]